MKCHLFSSPFSLERPAIYKRGTKPYSAPAAAPDHRSESNQPIQPPIRALAPANPKTPPAPSKTIEPLAFLTGVREFCDLDRATAAFIESDIPYYVNSFWPPGRAGRHPLHEFPYRASFSPHLASFFIDRLSQPGDIVHDPFLGSGTTVLQCALMGRIGYGTDINPYSALITRPRLDPSITLAGVLDRLASIDWSHGDLGRDDMGSFFHPKTARKIGALRRDLGIDARLDAQAPDQAADWIRMAAMARLTGHSAGYMSGLTLPPNQMMSIAGQQRLNKKSGLMPPERDVAAIIAAKSRSLLRKGCVPPTATHQLGTDPAWDTPWIENSSVDLVLTSPPFADVVDYGKENWMKLWFAGLDPRNIAFSHFVSLDDWRAMIRQSLIEMVRIVKPGGYIALEVGEIRGGSVALEKHVWTAAENLPCRRLGVIVHDAAFTKSSHIYGVKNGKLGTNTNRIVILQRM